MNDPVPGDFNDPRNKWEYFKAHTWWDFDNWLRECEDAMEGCFLRVMIWVSMFALIALLVLFLWQLAHGRVR